MSCWFQLNSLERRFQPVPTWFFLNPTSWMKVHAFWIRFDLLCPFPSKQAEFAHPRFMFLRLVFIAPYLSCSQDRVTLASPFLFGSFFSAFVMVVSLTMTTMMRSRFILSELSERLFARFESTKSQNQTQRIFFVFPVRNTLWPVPFPLFLVSSFHPSWLFNWPWRRWGKAAIPPQHSAHSARFVIIAV